MIADLDRDGNAELLGSEGATLKIWAGDGNPEFPIAPVSIPFGVGQEKIQILDMNLDGILDIVLGNFVLYGRGNYSYDPFNTHYPSGLSIVVGDSNGDGYPDIVLLGRTYFGSSNGLHYDGNDNGLSADTSGREWISGFVKIQIFRIA